MGHHQSICGIFDNRIFLGRLERPHASPSLGYWGIMVSEIFLFTHLYDWVGGFEHDFYFPSFGKIVIPTDYMMMNIAIKFFCEFQ